MLQFTIIHNSESLLPSIQPKTAYCNEALLSLMQLENKEKKFGQVHKKSFSENI